MIAFLDVHYRLDNAAIAAAVLASKWTATEPELEKTVLVSKVAPYQSGEFYKRELPPLLEILKALPPVEIVVVDGYVWLDADGKPGLGARLYEALEQKIPVIGVAKTQYAEFGLELLRAQSHRPLYITCEGIPLEVAAGYIAMMHGPRLPTLIKRADALAGEVAYPPEFGMWLLGILDAHLWELAEPWLETKEEPLEKEYYEGIVQRLSQSLAELEVDTRNFQDFEYPLPTGALLLGVWEQLMGIYYARLNSRISRILIAATGCSVIRNYLRDSIPHAYWAEVAPKFSEEILKFGRTLEPPLLESAAFKRATES